jgi:ParB family chromosome partitioning protein
MPPTETAAPPGKTLELLNPAEIIPRNVRQEPDAEMVDSIRRRGQLEPVVVLKAPDGSLFLRFGDRRRLACIALGRPVEAVVTAATDEEVADLITSILDQLAENDDRKPLTAADRAYAVQYLFELGVDEQAIEKETGYSRAEITAARKARKSDTARTLAAQYPLDMTQLAVIAEFDDAPELATGLAETARDNPAQFTHAAQLARDEREDAAMLAARAAELAEQGYAVGYERPHYEFLLTYWAGPDRKPLTPENHKDCPGSVVVLRTLAYADSRRVDESWWCTDPKGNGHKRLRTGQAERSPEEASAERSRVVEGNKAWKSATIVRQNWLRGVLLARKDLPGGAALFVARAIAAAEHHLTNAMSTMSGGSHTIARSLLGVEEDSRTGYTTGRGWVTPLLDLLGEVSEQRAQVITLALILGAYEQQTADPQTWRYPSPPPQQYLTALAAWGYPLSPIEQGVVDAATKTPTAAAATAEQD